MYGVLHLKEIGNYFFKSYSVISLTCSFTRYWSLEVVNKSIKEIKIKITFIILIVILKTIV